MNCLFWGGVWCLLLFAIVFGVPGTDFDIGFVADCVVGLYSCFCGLVWVTVC